MDPASSEFYNTETGNYELTRSGQGVKTTDEMIDMYADWCEKYPIISIEDPLDQRDFEGWRIITERIGDRVMLVGDDLFVTSPSRLKQGIELGAANAILVKPNQIGSLSEVIGVTNIASTAGYSYILSHRSGETEDTTIADLAVGLGAPFIKSGAPCRSDRVAKYNRLLRIEASLGHSATYGLNPDGVKPTATTYCGEQCQ